MAIGVMQDVWTRSKAKGLERLVLLALADSANADTRECWPSLPRIAERCALSVRRIQYALRTLENLGEVSVLMHAGRGHTSRYRIGLMGAGVCTHSEKGAPDDQKGARIPEKGCTTAPERVQTCAPGTVRDPSVRDPSEPSRHDRRHRKPETPWPGTEAILTEATRLYAKARGCRNVRLAVEHAGNDALAKGKMQRDWLAYMRKWLDNHGRYGCPCLKPIVPAYVPKREPVTGPFAGLTVGRKIV